MNEKNDEMMEKQEELTKLTIDSNKADGAIDSVFLMDTYLNHVSSASQADREDLMEEYYQKLEILSYEHGIAEGTHLLHSASSMKCIHMIRKG